MEEGYAVRTQVYVYHDSDADIGVSLDMHAHKLLLVRAMIAYCMSLFLSWSLTMIPFYIIVLVSLAAPIFIAYLGSRVNKEPAFKLEVLGMLACFICICIIMNGESDK